MQFVPFQHFFFFPDFKFIKQDNYEIREYIL